MVEWAVSLTAPGSDLILSSESEWDWKFSPCLQCFLPHPKNMLLVSLNVTLNVTLNVPVLMCVHGLLSHPRCS